jgi:hypothetical protein
MPTTTIMQRIVLGLKDIMIAASFLSCDVVEVVPGEGLKVIPGNTVHVVQVVVVVNHRIPWVSAHGSPPPFLGGV